VSVPPSLKRESEVSASRIPAAGGDLAALVGQPPETVPSGPPVLLVPGYTGSKEDFLPILAPLARAGHRAVAIDLRGQHESVGPDDPTAYTFDALAVDVRHALDSLGPEAHLVGHSMGGLIARRAILAGARPRSFTLVGSGPAALPGERADVVRLIAAMLTDRGAAAVAETAEQLNRADPTFADLPEDVHAFLRDRWLTSSVTGLVATGEELLRAPDETEALAAAGVPTLVVFGAGDNAWPPDLQRDMAARLGADVVEIPDAMHSPARESPRALVDALLTFWARVPA
jgi:pimeloyl-ACP methyl ester carboxylesterase